MKSLRDYSMNLPEQAYHDYPAWSHSMIVRYAKDGFKAISTIHDKIEPTPSMEFGSLFDSFITRGKNTVKEYTVLDVPVPDAEKKALDYIAARTDTRIEDIKPDDLMRYCDECGYYNKWGYDARLKHLALYQDYYDAKRTWKTVVSRKDWDDAMEMYNIFREDPYLNNLFGTKDTKDIEYIYQAQYCVDYTTDYHGTVKIKIMPDLMVVNHKDKTVQPVDLKTSSVPAYDFVENFIKFRYDIEASLYNDVIRTVMDKDEVYRNYTILPYLFTDISRTDKVPVTYVYDTTDFSQIDGLSYGQYKYKDYRTLLEEILDYEESNATVPSYIKKDAPNNIIDLLNKKYE